MTTDPITELSEISHEFGTGAARRKIELLLSLAGLRSLSAKRLRLLQDTLLFIRAYPDNPRVLREVQDRIASLLPLVRRHTGGDGQALSVLNSGLPGSSNSYAYSYGVLQRLVELFPGELEIDWVDLEDEGPLNDALEALLAPAEARGLEDEDLTLSEWFQTCRGGKQTDLEFLLQLVGTSSLAPAAQVQVFEGCNLPILFSLDGPGRGISEQVVTSSRVHFQSRPLSKDRFQRSVVRKPLSAVRHLPREAGQKMIDLSLRSLCARNLEIYPLVNGNPDDVTMVSGERGVEILLVGTQPRFRTVPETLLFFLILKNGVPTAYGPASLFMGVCEMGINLFPEFRGVEIRSTYTQLMRTLYHLANVRFFYLTPYGMGVDNPDAIRTGAFWFYRKLGFRPSNPEVEVLARREEAIMRKNPGHRSSRSTLRQLSNTHAHLDFSGGKIQRFEYGKISQAASRLINRHHQGDRPRARRGMARRVVRDLGIPAYSAWSATERLAMEQLAPLVALIPDLAGWPPGDKRSLARAIRSRGKMSEFPYARALIGVPRLAGVLEKLGSDS